MIKKWSSLVKISHLVFSLPFAIIGFALAFNLYAPAIDWWFLLYIILAVFFARNAAMAFNRIADSEFDVKNNRTKNREIPQKIISKSKAYFFVGVNSMLFILVSFFINALCFKLSFLALIIILSYSLLKRFTWLCHYFLGLSLAISPMGAYLSISGKFDFVPMILSLSVLFWVSSFDILYALQDEEFDRENNLHSVPQAFGRRKALWISRIGHFISALLLFYVGYLIQAGVFFYIGLGIFSIILFYEQFIVKPNDISKVNLAFATLNGFAGIIFATFSLLDLFLFYFI